MNRRKEILNEYKERKLQAVAYRVINPVNRKYYIDHAANLKSAQNHSQFALKTARALNPTLKKDWEEFGAQTFSIEILEELEQREDQTQAQFMDELKTLEQLHRATFDPAKEYWSCFKLKHICKRRGPFEP